MASRRPMIALWRQLSNKLRIALVLMAFLLYFSSASVSRSRYFGEWATEHTLLVTMAAVIVVTGAISTAVVMLPSLFCLVPSFRSVLGSAHVVWLRALGITLGGVLVTTAVARGQPIDVALAVTAICTLFLAVLFRFLTPSPDMTRGAGRMVAEGCVVISVVFASLLTLNLAIAAEMATMAQLGRTATAVETAVLVLACTGAAVFLYTATERRAIVARTACVFAFFAVVMLSAASAFSIFASSIALFTGEGGGGAVIRSRDSERRLEGLPVPACADAACAESKELHVVFRFGNRIRFLYRADDGSLVEGTLDATGVDLFETSPPVFRMRWLWL